MANFEEMAKNRLEQWMKEETPEGSRSEGSDRFNRLLTDWIDAVRHYDSTIAFEDSEHNRELTVLHLKKLQEILSKLEENAQQIQAVPGEGESGDQQGEGSGEGGDQESEGNGDEEEEDGADGEEKGDQGDGGDRPKPADEGDGDESKKPKPGESPEEAARRILKENADLQKGALSPGRARFNRPEKDW